VDTENIFSILGQTLNSVACEPRFVTWQPRSSLHSSLKKTNENPASSPTRKENLSTMLICLIFQLLAYAVGSLEFHCKEKRVSVCERKESSEHVVFVSTLNDEFFSAIKDSLCFFDQSEMVK
jgi:hypothetical protein